MATDGTAADQRPLRRWLAELRRDRAEAGWSSRSMVATVVAAVADRCGATPPDTLPGDRAAIPPPPAGWCTPRLPGLVYEALTDPTDRRTRGAWFTPPAVVDRLVGLALDGGTAPATVLDPACGGGAFLLGVADALHRRGLEAGDVVGRLAGIDLDAGAIEVCRWSIELWAAANGRPGATPELVVGDGLALPWEPVDLVVGNPPFASPLRADRADSPASRYRTGRPLLGPYADDAACFLERSAGLVAPGGRLVLVLPQSLLASRDASDLLADLHRSWRLRHLWIADRAVFDAAVHVFAPVLAREPASGRRPQTSPVGLHRHAGVEPAGRSAAGTCWADVAADGLGIPPSPARGSGRTLGDLVEATSGFRDQHYGLAAACREAAERPGGAPVVTVGQIDPLCRRLDRPIRFGGRLWTRPVVDVEALPPALAAWTARQLRPKILLATQSRVLEPLIDRSGTLVPSTPVIAVHADPDDLDRVAAVLLAPPVVAWAARRSVGTALQPQGIKLAARQVLELPLPERPGPWREAVALLAGLDAGRAAPPELLGAVAALMCRAYGVEPEPWWSWWWRRLPRRPATEPGVPGGAGRVDP